MKPKTLHVALLTAFLASVAASGSYAAPPSAPAPNTALPCATAEFEAGLGPLSELTYPVTGTVVSPTKITTQQNTWAGTWLGDAHPGRLLQAQLFVDKKLASTQDFTARKSTPLVWNASKAAQGMHELMLRVYVADDTDTDSCYLDSAYVYPVVQ